MVIGAKRKRHTTTIVRSKIRERIFFAALTVAAFAFLLMATGTRFVMNNWSTEKLELAMSESLTRPVHLGRTSWSLGLNGLILSTSSLAIDEKDGRTRFMTSGQTEIGLAFFPMARGEFYPRHLRLVDPQVNAVRISGDRWNFSDLGQVPALKYVSWMEISGGRVKLVDQATPAQPWSGRRLENITLLVQKPGEHGVWPFAITADAPGEGYVTKVNLTGIGTGALDDWAKNNHTFEAEVNNLNTADIRLFTSAAPKMHGFVDAKLKGQGIPEAGFHANAELTTKALRVPIARVGDWNIIDGTSSADIDINQDSIAWSNFSLTLPDVLVRSQGKVTDWKSTAPSYDTNFDFVASDVSSLTSLVPARIMPRDVLGPVTARRLATNPAMTVAEALAPARFGGPGIIKAVFSGKAKDLKAEFAVRGDRMTFHAVTPRGTAVDTVGKVDIKLNLVSTHEPKLDTVSGTAAFTNGILSIDGGQPVAEKITGNVTIRDTDLVLQNVAGKFGLGNFSLTGVLPQKFTGPVALKYVGDNVNILQVKRVLKALAINSPLTNDQRVAGSLRSAEVDVSGTPVAPIVTMAAVPKDIYFQTGSLERALRITSGNMFYRGGVFNLDNVAGRLGRGTFLLNGTSAPRSNNLSLSANNIDMSDVDLAVRGLDIRPISLQPQILYGTISEALVHVSGPTSNPVIDLSVKPSHLYYVPKGFQPTFVLTGGSVLMRNQQVSFDNLKGALGRGTFNLNGTAKLQEPVTANLSLTGRNLDLSNIKLALQAMQVKHPLLAQQLLFGTAQEIKFSLKGNAKSPQISLVAIPESIYFEPPGSSRTLHLSGGHVSFKNDILLLDRVRVQTERSSMLASVRMDNLGKGSQLKILELNTSSFDLGDMHSYLTAQSTPHAVRDTYLKLISEYGLSVPKGKVAGVFRMDSTEGRRLVGGQLTLSDFGITFYGYPIYGVNGRLVANGNDLLLQDIKGGIGKSPFVLAGVVKNAASAAEASWDADLKLDVNVRDFLALIAAADSNMRDIITASKPIPVHMRVVGNLNGTVANFTSDIAPETILSLGGPFGGVTKPAGQPVKLQGKLAFGAKSPRIQITESKVAIGDTVIGWTGEYLVSDTDAPKVHFNFEVPEPIPVTRLAALLPDNRLKDLFKGASGTAKGKLEFEGPATETAMRGHIDVIDAALPQLKLAAVTGRLNALDWFPPKKPTASEKAMFSPGRSELQVSLSTVRVSDAMFKDVTGKLVAENTARGSKLTLKEVTASLYGGKATFDGWVVLDADRQFNLLTRVSDVDADALLTALFNAPGELTGKIEARAHLEGRAANSADFIRHLKGVGSFTARNGRVLRLKELQTKITQGNFLMQGVIGFDMNNLLATLAPVKSGAFESIEAKFRLRDEKLNLARVGFNGSELRLRGEGVVDLHEKILEAKIAGNIPRTARSFLPKPVSKVVSWLSPGTLLNVIAAHTSLDFPSLPILGSPGGSKPRSFEFTIKADLTKPDTIAKAITDTFQFLPPQPAATAYPPIGLSMSSRDERLFEPTQSKPDVEAKKNGDAIPAPPAPKEAVAENSESPQDHATKSLSAMTAASNESAQEASRAASTPTAAGVKEASK